MPASVTGVNISKTGNYTILITVSKYPITAMHPGKTPETLTEEELIILITASVTNMTSQVC
ncbi:hypothetical protein CF017_04430 [Citrobacter braakii]|nr:hypothetical protein CF017_04430 [Citrobacter braakii]TCC74967.1 hypothetical protein EY917_06005 [Citrobacter braakii]